MAVKQILIISTFFINIKEIPRIPPIFLATECVYPELYKTTAIPIGIPKIHAASGDTAINLYVKHG